MPIKELIARLQHCLDDPNTDIYDDTEVYVGQFVEEDGKTVRKTMGNVKEVRVYSDAVLLAFDMRALDGSRGDQ